MPYLRKPMQAEVKFAVLVGRMLDLFGQSGDAASDDHRTALHALVDLAAGRSATLRSDGTVVTVEGQPIPDETAFLGLLRERLAAHGVAELRITSGASPVDLVHAIRALAAPPARSNPGAAIDQHLRRAKVTTVSVVTAELERSTRDRRGVRVTEALQAVNTGSRAGQEDTQLGGVITSARGAAYDEMMRHQRAAAKTLTGAVARLADLQAGPALRNQLEAVQAAIGEAVKGKEVNQALEAIVALIRLEAATADPDVRRSFGIALRRILTQDTLRRFSRFLLDDMYASDIVMIVRRSGTPGTKILLDLLIHAPTQAERRAYLRALQQVEEGLDVVTSLLSHHEWFVVRNAADLVGELGIEEATSALGTVVGHEDARVRMSVGIALARLGTPTAAQYLRKVFSDPDPKVRLAVLKQVGGKGASALAMPLVNAAQAERDDEVVCEYYRALGRIGTPDAVQALTNAARSGSGRLLVRRPSAARLAAVEGLGSAGGPIAVEALESLSKDRAGDMRRVARKALAQARAH